MMRRAFLMSALFALFAISSEAGEIDSSTAIFEPTFRSLKVSNANDFMAPPLIRLNSQDRILISFDEMAEDPSDLCARLIHCNSDWQPSALLESEYLQGFNMESLDDYGFSSNTFHHFVNYRFTFPSESLVPTVSGNYLLQIYERDDPDTTLLQARFQVVEPLITTTGDLTTRTDRDTNDSHQQLSLRLLTRDYRIDNPYNDLKVSVVQNNRPATERFLTAPLRIAGPEIVYEHQTPLIFPASNEYRRFETVRASYPGMHVDSVAFIGRGYHAYLTPDADRSEHQYVYDETQHGRFLIREYNSTDSDLGADYVTVHFTLDFPELIGADIFVEGEMTANRCLEEFRMRYDHDAHLYRLEVPLKQGSYNYQYVVRGTDAPHWSGDPGVVEGNKYETSNEYLVSVYHRPVGARADRLVSAALITK